MSDLPPDTYYGKAVGQFLLANADASDPGDLPDALPMEGEVKITPLVRVYRNPNPNAPLVSPTPVVCTLDEEGNLRDPEGSLGVWLVEGEYKVKYILTNARIPTHRLTVTRANDETHPVNLRSMVPPVGPVATPGQYAELSARIDAMDELSPVDSVNGKDGVVVLDASDVDAYSKTEIDIQLDVLEAADAAESAARISGDSALDTRVDALESAPSVPNLTVPLAALTSRVTVLEEAPSGPDLSDELAAEAAARIAADSALDTRVDALESAPGGPDLSDELAAEVAARIAADSALDSRVDTLEATTGPDLSGYVTDAELATSLSAYATDAELASGLAGKANVGAPPAAHGNSHNKDTGSDPITPADIGAATAAQGAKADTAVQPAALTAYATTAFVTDGLALKSDSAHNHDSRYYTESEINAMFASYSPTSPAGTMIYKGNWNSGTTYAAGDAVGSGSAFWVAKVANTNSLPSTTQTISVGGADAINGDWAWSTVPGGIAAEIVQPIRVNADALVAGVDLGFYATHYLGAVQVGLAVAAPSGSGAVTLIQPAVTVTPTADGTTGNIYWSRLLFETPIQLLANTTYFLWVRDETASNFGGGFLLVNDGSPATANTSFSGSMSNPSLPGQSRTNGGTWANMAASRHFTSRILVASAVNWERLAIELDSTSLGRSILNAASAAAVRTAIDAAPGTPTIDVKTGAYTVALTDVNKTIEVNSATGVTISIPTNASVAFPIGSIINFTQTGAGAITFAAVTPGTTTLNTRRTLVTAGQWAGASIQKRGTDLWVVVGDMT